MPLAHKDFIRFADLELLDSIVGQLRKGLELYYKWWISVIKIRWKLQLIGFSYDKQSANVYVWVHLKRVKYAKSFIKKETPRSPKTELRV